MDWTSKDAYTYLSYKGGSAYNLPPFNRPVSNLVPPFAITAFSVEQNPAFFQTRVLVTAVPGIQFQLIRLPEPVSRKTTSVMRKGRPCQVDPVWYSPADRRLLGIPQSVGSPNYSCELLELGGPHLVTYQLRFCLRGLPTQFLLKTQGPIVTVLANANWP